VIKITKELLRFFVIAAFSLGFLVFPRPAKAFLFNGDNFVFDSFDNLTYATDENAVADYWWVTLNSIFPPIRQENVPCAGIGNASSNCLIIQGTTFQKYAHFEMQPDPLSPFWFVQMTDVKDSSTALSGKELRWQPEPGGKIVLTSRVRFSDNYKDDASGSAHGSAGMGFWNMPTYLLPEFPFVGSIAPKAIWFTFTEAGSLNGQFVGYHGNLYDYDEPRIDLPTATEELRGFDMNDWFIQRLVWQADQNGNQSVTFKIIQGLNVIEKTVQLARPLPPLSFASWLDSSKLVSTEGTILTQVSPIVENQWMDVDWILITDRE
jgi:hypothetical protein